MRIVYNAILDLVRAFVASNRKLDAIYALQLAQGDQLDIISDAVSLEGIEQEASPQLTILVDRLEATANRLKAAADRLNDVVKSEE